MPLTSLRPPDPPCAERRAPGGPGASSSDAETLRRELCVAKRRIAELEEELIDKEIRLEEALAPPEPMPHLGLPRQASKVYGALKQAAMRNPEGFVQRQTLHTAIYGLLDGAPDWKIIDVQICRIRKMLPPGERIETIWGQGYRLIIG